MPMAPGQLDRVVTAVTVAGLPLLLYVDGRDDCASRILAIARTTDTEVLIREVPDERFVLGRFLEQRGVAGAPARLLARLTVCLTCLGPKLKASTVSLLAWGPIPSAVADFVPKSLHRRTTERQFARAGLCGVAPLIDGARLARAWVTANDYATLGLVAARAGYESERTLTRHSHQYVGLPLCRAKRQLTTDEFVDRIAQRICRVATADAPVAKRQMPQHDACSPNAGQSSTTDSQ